MVKKLVVASAVVAAAVAGSGGVASGHVHSLRTPGGKTVAIPCEPFHGTTPGASEHSANWDESRGLHPIHWGLHKSPAEEHRAIELVVTAATCE